MEGNCKKKRTVESQSPTVKPDRRKVIKTLGKYGAFTAPALVVLLTNPEGAPGSPL